MHTKEQLTEYVAESQKFLEEKPGSEPNDIISRIENMAVLIAKSGECLADAKYYLDQRKNDAIELTLTMAKKDGWSISIIHKKIDALCKDDNYLVNKLDRINAAATHQLDGLRSILSYRKTEFHTLSYARG